MHYIAITDTVVNVAVFDEFDVHGEQLDTQYLLLETARSTRGATVANEIHELQVRSSNALVMVHRTPVFLKDRSNEIMEHYNRMLNRTDSIAETEHMVHGGPVRRQRLAQEVLLRSTKLFPAPVLRSTSLVLFRATDRRWRVGVHSMMTGGGNLVYVLAFDMTEDRVMQEFLVPAGDVAAILP